ncbi:peptidase E [Enemella evansiae]|uniref:Type 1 glutamine amidotransferase-like domain-containing protein n=1 Tax=Enemella evansiae TaxID=2016499 RepID=UPI000B974829|nr:peptidase E [Enemella evansiae]OYO04440.1 peptidase E [Enemella evansiae]
MTAETPTILATSGGVRPGEHTALEFSPLTELAVELADVTGRAPRICFLATALGDSESVLLRLYAAAQAAGYQPSHLQLFPMPNVASPAEQLLAADVIWVMGGSVAGLLAMWELHGLAAPLRQAWESGVVLTGVSAGSICWHVGGTTDSFGPELRPVDNGLAFLPFANGVHYDSEERRRPLFQRLIAEGTLPAGYATDDGAGLLYRGTEGAAPEAVSEKDGAHGYFVERGTDGAVETVLDTRRL